MRSMNILNLRIAKPKLTYFKLVFIGCFEYGPHVSLIHMSQLIQDNIFHMVDALMPSKVLKQASKL